VTGCDVSIHGDEMTIDFSRSDDGPRPMAGRARALAILERACAVVSTGRRKAEAFDRLGELRA
jgi:hypothetical protein